MKNIRVYIDNSCPLVPPVLSVLKDYDMEITQINIDYDISAQENLKLLTGGYLSVPTLVMSDGTIMIEPTPLEVKDCLVTISGMKGNLVVQPSISNNQLLMVLGVYLFFIGCLMIFRFGIQITRLSSYPNLFLQVIICSLILVIVFYLVSLVPFIQKAVRKITFPFSQGKFRFISILISSFIAGMIISISQRNKPNIMDINQILPFVAVSTLIAILLGRFTRRFWVKPYDLLADIRSKIGWLITIGFVIVLAAYWIFGQLGMQAAAAFLFGPLFFACLLACLRTARGVRNGQIISHTSSLLFSCLGLIILFAMF